MNVKTKGFALELADLLEKHSIYITAPNTDPENKIFSYVNFIARGRSESLMPKLQRCHVSSYDLRCQTGMSSREANELYQSNKQYYIDALKPTTPIYTQAMCDAGELPSVGMECVAVYGSSKDKVTVVHTNDKNQFCCIDDRGDYLIHYPKDNLEESFKPITPPIELKDGKAYQFTYGNTPVITGLYSKQNKQLQAVAGHYEERHCTNIKPLTVKGEE